MHWRNLGTALCPLTRGGAAAPIRQMQRYLRFGAGEEVRALLQEGSDHFWGCTLSRLRYAPRSALFKVARYFFYRARRFLLKGTTVQAMRHFQQGKFPSSHHREEGWPSDQENTAQHPLFARTGWCSYRTDKEHHPDGVDKEASRHFLGDAATPPRGDARRGIRFFQNDTSKPHMFSWPLWTGVRTISSKQLGQLWREYAFHSL